MDKKQKIIRVLWVVIAAIAVASVISLTVFPHWKGLFFAGSGGFLILNMLLMIFFVSKNMK